MQYLLQLTFRPGEGPQEGTPEFDAEMTVWHELNDELRASGQYLAASGLKVDAATTVRKTGDEVTVTDGPFAETKEVLFSFYILEVPDLDAAIAVAARTPAAEYGSVDIRPMGGASFAGAPRRARSGGRTATSAPPCWPRSRAGWAATSRWPRTTCRTRSSSRLSTGTVAAPRSDPAHG